MFQLPNCPACKAFEREVGDRYEFTDEAQTAPLRRLSLRTPPTHLQLDAALEVSPTFVLVENGREVDRFVGYSRDEQFWMSMQRMLNGLDKAEN